MGEGGNADGTERATKDRSGTARLQRPPIVGLSRCWVSPSVGASLVVGRGTAKRHKFLKEKKKLEAICNG